MQQLPDDLLVELFLLCKLDLEFASLALVCKHWHDLVANNARLWTVRTKRLFEGKHLSPYLQSLPFSKSTYLYALQDCKRQVITQEELCHHWWGMRLHEYGNLAHLNPANGVIVRRFLPNGQYWYPKDNDPLFSHPDLGPHLDPHMQWKWSPKGLVQLVHMNLEPAFPPMFVVRLSPNWSWEIVGQYATYSILPNSAVDARALSRVRTPE
ncbi:hypothetical protein BASA81_000258 [Batrachochytrium salamandrivorans]|nr:hypothetical protein BASA81_000258 [Batrachochytrium salamandrivorans]